MNSLAGERFGAIRKDGPKCKLVKEISSKQLKGLILAQNERWRRGLGMQVAR